MENNIILYGIFKINMFESRKIKKIKIKKDSEIVLLFIVYIF